MSGQESGRESGDETTALVNREATHEDVCASRCSCLRDCFERVLLLCFSGTFLAAGLWCLMTDALLQVDGITEHKERIHLVTMIVTGLTISIAVLSGVLPQVCGQDELKTFIIGVFDQDDTEAVVPRGLQQWYFDTFKKLDPLFHCSCCCCGVKPFELIYSWECWSWLRPCIGYFCLLLECSLVFYPWWWYCRIVYFPEVDFSRQVKVRWMWWTNQVISWVAIGAILRILVVSLGQHLLVCRWSAMYLTKAIEDGYKEDCPTLSALDWHDLLGRLASTKHHLETFWKSWTICIQWVCWLVVAASIALLGAVVVIQSDQSKEQKTCKLMGWSYLAFGSIILLALLWLLGCVAALFYHPSSLETSVSAAAHKFCKVRKISYHEGESVEVAEHARRSRNRTLSEASAPFVDMATTGHQDLSTQVAFQNFIAYVDRNVIGVRVCGKLISPKFVNSIIRMLAFYTPSGLLLLDATLLKHLQAHSPSHKS